MRRQVSWIGPLAGVALWAGGLPADAQQKRPAPRKAPPPLVGAKVQATVTPERGFVDDPLSIDGAGSRLVWINADAAALAELVVLDLRQGGARLATVDISGFTTTPVRVDFALDGEHFFVVSRAADGEPVTGALVDRAGKAVRTFGPADDVVMTSYEGQPAAVVYRRSTPKARGKGGATVVHEIAVHSLATGRPIGRTARLAADRDGFVKELDFRIRTFAADYTRVVGIRGGRWDRKQNQRSPDHEAWYEAPTGAFGRRVDITDVVAHTRRMNLLAEHPNEEAFLVADLDGVRRIEHGGEAALTLPHPFHHYDFRTLTYQRTAAGGFFFTLQIDPYHAEAVEQKRADAKYLDLYELAPGATKARRRARVLLAGDRDRDHRWRATRDHWVLLPRHRGFGRGGDKLELLRLE